RRGGRVGGQQLPLTGAHTSPLSRSQTGIRERIMQGSPPHTSERESIPGKASPKSWTIHLRICAVSPGESSGNILSKSLRPAISNLVLIVANYRRLLPRFT